MKIIFIGIVAVSLTGNLFAGINNDAAYWQGIGAGSKISVEIKYMAGHKYEVLQDPHKYCEEQTLDRYKIINQYANDYYNGCLSRARTEVSTKKNWKKIY